MSPFLLDCPLGIIERYARLKVRIYSKDSSFTLPSKDKAHSYSFCMEKVVDLLVQVEVHLSLSFDYGSLKVYRIPPLQRSSYRIPSRMASNGTTHEDLSSQVENNGESGGSRNVFLKFSNKLLLLLRIKRTTKVVETLKRKWTWAIILNDK